MNDIVRVVDLETTGFLPQHNAREPGDEKNTVCEIAWADIDLDTGKIINTYEQLINPGIPIPPDASAVHHITDEHVFDAPTLDDVIAISGFLDDDFKCFGAHNAEFDSSFLPNAFNKGPWLCTARLAKHLLPDVPKHNNQFLRYSLKLDVPEAEGMAAHRALVDALVTARLLAHLKGVYVEKHGAWDTDAVIQFAEAPILMRTCRFGKKHWGQEWKDVPKSYLQWMLQNVTDMDRDTKYTVEHYANGGA